MDLVGLVAIIMGCSIPISAIVGGFVYKYKKEQLKLKALNNEDILLLQSLKDENKLLKERLENVELIVTSSEEYLKLK